MHDIGKNLVDIILTNNGYEVINLGIKIGINEMITAAEEHKADAIGMSGLLVKSTLIMRENLVELNQRDLADFPILLGGAALTRTYVERDLREVYDGRLFYGRDAFEGLRTMDRLVELKKSGEDDPIFGREISAKNVPKRSRLEPQDTTPVEGQPARSAVAADNPIFVPPFVGTRVAKGIAARRHRRVPEPDRALPQPVGFQAGERRGRQRVQGRGCGPSCAKSWPRPRRVTCSSPRWPTATSPPTPRATTSSSGRTRHATSEWMRFTFPRQRKEPWLCISDFFRSTDSGDEDFASFMLCTIGHRASEEAARLFAENQYHELPVPPRPRRRDGRGDGRVLASPRSVRSSASPTRTGRRWPVCSARRIEAGVTPGATRPARTSWTTPRWSSSSAASASA